MELRDVLRLLRDHWLAIVATILLGTILAFGWSLTQKPRYVADSQGIVSVSTAGNSNDDQAIYTRQIADSVAKSSLATYVPIASSRAVAEIAIQNLGLDVSPESLIAAITVTPDTAAPVLKVTASASTPDGAKKLADAWVSAIATRVQQVNQDTGVGDSIKLAVVQAAALPSAPAFPNLRLVLAVGALMGLVLGLIYAFVRNTLDRRIRTAEMVERLFDLPVVGTLPIDKRLSDTNRIVPEADTTDYVKSDGKHALAESLRELRTNLQFMNVDSPPRIIVVTSPLPSDGKSTVTANLAVTLAASGQRTVVVDGDLRKPTVAKSFGLVPGVGLTDLLIGKAELQDVLQPWGPSGNLWILGAGSIPPNPSELLGSNGMDILLHEIAREAIVIVDAPPLLPVTDGAILTARTDGALVVISAGKTTTDELGKAIQNLERVSGHTLGVILNRVPPRGQVGRGYGYYYTSYYGSERSGARPEAAAAPASTTA
ncbi:MULTISPECIES: polysaccharide biosynthesis tyrosine autokinase [unclassified Rathayibacter]|uniref:polysaccharide biosynthesis tyrosine autokinase n=1 Tax=unclassified Rathayibacter TaxID=2609250 RepID=UPI00188DA541|nr:MULTISPECIES: polysaccharide biosynthesis tyrosine autokinase [unclassified Rathayibacter]MBF4462875.1 polysaccharide biosynthesis tyrosine autokinase [Rathayibacter sp. VKM Ac-2879]MBF4504289.1 polysaccharide biosynthesis tyrosine autokinase [Rathayibacter sp. VKM Ac-2878]